MDILTLDTKQAKEAQENSFIPDGQREAEEAEAQKRENIAKELQSPKKDYTKYFSNIDNPQAQKARDSQNPQNQQNADNPQSAEVSVSGQAIVHLPTGYAYFDEKMAKGTLNIIDGYIARQLLGLDLTKHCTIDMNAKVRNQSTTKLLNDAVAVQDTMFRGLKAQSLARDDKSLFENAGLKGGFTRWLHNFTGGITPIDIDNEQFNANEKAFSFGMANIMTDGRVTNKDKEVAEKTFGAGFKDVAEYTAGVGEALGIGLTKYDSIIKELEEKGIVAPVEMVATRNYLHSAQQAMTSKGKKFDLNKFNAEYLSQYGKDNAPFEVVESFAQRAKVK